MPNLKVIEIKAFIPAKDFELSKRFYQDVGFTLTSSGGGVAYLHCGDASFLLQDFYTDGLAKDFTMHLLVEDVEAWWNQLNEAGIAAKYGVIIGNIETQPWRMRDFELTDPSGVCWRIAQNIN
jgi:hypothetical protein